ncbi:hypothetical protein OGATHE_004534 [Ogataea polymorpha]|uniref:Uncharacterized protein n=1 Tax=Ogataea polymorpha TaxID=460523 RepID=A0A9P8T1M2_9ASCO|nr:hypothetical protein OGATHE_004534 [Ogataea polymorpha]
MSESFRTYFLLSVFAGESLTWFRNVPDEEHTSFKYQVPLWSTDISACCRDTTLLLKTTAAEEPCGAVAALLHFSVYLPTIIDIPGLILRIRGPKYINGVDDEWSMNGVRRIA